MTRTIRALLADDHTLVRAGLRGLLESVAHVEVVAEAGDGEQALEAARTHRPDLVLMDISMKRVNGIEATERLLRELPGIRVLMLSMHREPEHVTQALRAGASGYLLKDAATDELAVAVQSVLRGEVYLSPAVLRPVETGAVRSQIPDSPRGERLTARQREVLKLIAEGYGTKRIAQTLDISVKTVETHRAELVRRLGIRDVAGLTRYAIRIGLVSEDR